jgi:hypothetical protein
MERLFSAVARGVGYGAFMGLGLGLVTGAVGMFGPAASDVTVTFQHPHTGETLAVDTFGLDGDAHVVQLLARAQQSLDYDPSIRPSARKQFVVVLAKVRGFYLALRSALADPENTARRIRARKAATSAAQSITNLESHVWDSPEIETILSSVAQVQATMVQRALTLDASASP